MNRLGRPTLRRIPLSSTSKADVLHVETPAGIINIWHKLTDAEGHPVVSIEVLVEDGWEILGPMNLRIRRKEPR